MKYREIKPKAPLVGFVECFWTLEDSEGNGTNHDPEPILPDGCVELILNFGERFREHRDDGNQVYQPTNMLVGQMTRPTLIAPTGMVSLVGIRFQPGGTLPFFRLAMHEITDKIIELGAFAGTLERDLVACVAEADRLNEKVTAIESLLIERVRNCKHDSWLNRLAAAVVQQGGCITVDTIASTAGVSARHLQRRFLQDVGIGPKLFCRVLRFQQVFRAVERDKSGWASVAHDCGYYDQAHLIRDFQQFAGQPPAFLFSHLDPLTESFTRKNRKSDFSNTMS